MRRVYTFAVCFNSGYYYHVQVATEDGEKAAHKLAWSDVPDHQKDNVECLDLVECN